MYFNLMTPLDLSLPLPGIPQLVVAIAEFLGVAGMLRLLPLRFSKSTTVLLCIPVFLGQIYLRCMLSDYEPMPEFYLCMVLNVLYMIACVFLLCKGNLWGLLTAGSIAFMAAETNAAVVWPAVFLLFREPTMANPIHFAIVVGLMILLELLLICFLKETDLQANQTLSMAVRMSVLSLMAFLFSNSLMVFNSESGNIYTVAIPFSICRAAVDLCALLLVYNIHMSHRRHAMERETLAIDGIVKMQYKQYEEYKDSVEYISRQCHDLKHQLSVLRDARHQDELRQEMDKMEAMINRYEATANTGNPVLDTILTQKMLYCMEHEIQMSYSVDAHSISGIRTTDICTLFGNLLENAIEHVQQMELLEDRQIILTVQRQGNLLAVAVENRCDAEVPDNRLPHTTKQENTVHGFGCRSITYVAESYGGSARFAARDGWFTATVLLTVNTGSDREEHSVQ